MGYIYDAEIKSASLSGPSRDVVKRVSRRKAVRSLAALGVSPFLTSFKTIAIPPGLQQRPSMKYTDMDPLNPMKAGTNSLYVRPNSEYYYHNMDQLGFRLDWVKRGGRVFPLERRGNQDDFSYGFLGKEYTAEQFLTRSNVLGMLILHEGEIVFEQYRHGASRDSRFLTQSAGKSLTGILVGVAIEEGDIRSADDPVVKYLPYLKDSGYQNVTVRHLLQMTSGIKWSEDYSGKQDSDVPKLYSAIFKGTPTIKELAMGVRNEVPPGTAHNYQSLNTFVLGLILEAATKTPFHVYTSSKLWSKIGAMSDGFYYSGHKFTEPCAAGTFNATAEDYARVGWMMVNGGRLPGHVRVISERWIQETLNPDTRVKGLSPEKSPPERLRNGMRTYGYNNQWYIAEHEEAQDSDRILIAWGAFGQMLYVNLSRRTVGVHISAWDNPAPLFKWDEMVTFMNACARKLHPGSKTTR